MSTEFKTLPLAQTQLKFTDSNTSAFSGYACVFGGVDNYGDTIYSGAFSDVLAQSNTVKMYYNHRWLDGELPIGKMQLIEDDTGLLVKHAEFTPDLPQAHAVASAIKHGTVDGLSIGFRLKPGDFSYKNNGKGRNIKRIDVLQEVSVVDYPADKAARLCDVRRAINEAVSLKQIECVLREAGSFSRSNACALVSRIKSLAHGERGQSNKTDNLATIIRQVFDHHLTTVSD